MRTMGAGVVKNPMEETLSGLSRLGQLSFIEIDPELEKYSHLREQGYVKIGCSGLTGDPWCTVEITPAGIEYLEKNN